MKSMELKAALQEFLANYFISIETNIFDDLLMEHFSFDWKYDFAKEDIGFIFSDSHEAAEVRYRIPQGLSVIDLHKLLRFLGLAQHDDLSKTEVVVPEKAVLKLLNLFKTVFKSQSLQTISAYMFASRPYFEERYIKTTKEILGNVIAVFIPEKQKNPAVAHKLLNLLSAVQARMSALEVYSECQQEMHDVLTKLRDFCLKNNGFFMQEKISKTNVKSLGPSKEYFMLRDIIGQLDKYQMLYEAESIFAVGKFEQKLESFANKKLMSIFKSDIFELGLLQLSGAVDKPLRCQFLPGRMHAKPNQLRIEFIYATPADAEKLALYFKEVLGINKLDIEGVNEPQTTFYIEAVDSLGVVARPSYVFMIDGKEALNKILPDFKRNFAHLEPRLVAECQAKSRHYLAELNIPSSARFLTSEFTLWSKVTRKQTEELAAEIRRMPML